jgi:hypothetical protein
MDRSCKATRDLVMRDSKHMHPVPDLSMLIPASGASFRRGKTRPVAKRYFRLWQSSDPSLLGFHPTPPEGFQGFPAEPSSACLACESPPVIRQAPGPWWLAQGIRLSSALVSLAPANANHGRHLNPTTNHQPDSRQGRPRRRSAWRSHGRQLLGVDPTQTLAVHQR